MRVIQPLLQAKDAPALAAALRCRWTGEQITQLLGSDDPDAPKVAALALALVGGRCCIDALVRQLRHGDATMNQIAEHALWSIWFRLGKPQANHHLCRGTQALNRSEFQHANEHFTTALKIDPAFSEAFNQRAIAYYLQESYAESLEDCRRATELMPCHFGAWAGMGHCYAHLKEIRPAIAAYERALDINPRLDCVREAVGELRRCCDS